jgi:cation:H+ antiporter
MLSMIGLLMLGLILLYVGAEWLVLAASAIGRRLGIAPLVIGLTVVAFGTSAPELIVSVQAALAGRGEIAIGNVVGSNIANIALILGISALVRPLAVHAQLLRREVWLVPVISALLCLLLLNGRLSRIEGALLAVLLFAYLAWSLREARAEQNPEVEQEYAKLARSSGRPAWQYCLLIVISLGVLVAGATLLIKGAVDLARLAGVSEAVIGLTLVAVGTSLPELATSVVASMRREGDIAIGNVLGSNLFNILGILGITALLAPVASGGISWFDLSAMVAIAIIAVPMLHSGLVISRGEGAVLLALYIAYLGWLLL